MIFSVIISEKGGAERRESFDRTEINVGRVQGNDLMLPKGNVSKRHARLLFRDGRFIVNDLKSTNGTYVNGRKIAQATIVREGDKIYIGDFVLRIEAGPGAQLAPPQRSASGEYSGVIPDLVADGPQSQGPASVSQGKPRDGILTGEQNAVQEVVSHFPLENDPDEAPAAPAAVPGPPRVPRPAQSTKPSGTVLSPTALSAMPPTTSAPPPLGTRSPSGSSIPAPPQSPFPGPVFGMKTAIPPAPVLDRVDRIASEPGTGGSGPSLAHRAALRALLERAAMALPVGSLEAGTSPDQALSAQITAELKERATAMQAAGQLPEGVTVDQIVGEARRELCELGPIGPLLADDDVVEIHVKDHERLLAYRRSRKQPTTEMAFSSEAALARTLQRIARPAAPQEEPALAMTFRTAEGVRVVAVSKGPEKGHCLVLRKPQRAETATIEELVRSGLLSRVVATLLQQCMAGRANVLVTGAAGSGYAMLLAALSQTSTAEERVVALQDEDEIAADVANVLSIPLPLSPAEGARVARAAMQMRPDRLVIGALHGAVAAEVVLGLAEGSSSLLAAARAPTLRHALARLTTQLVANRPGLDVVSARETIASSFDLVLEVARLRDGRARLVRLAELAVEGGALVTKDIFTFTIERTAAAGAIEGSLHPTGTVPMLVEDLAVRGVAVDPAIFRRAPGR